VVDGEVLAHSPGQDEIEKELTKLRNERRSLLSSLARGTPEKPT
jgi:hypothetical protein